MMKRNKIEMNLRTTTQDADIGRGGKTGRGGVSLQQSH